MTDNRTEDEQFRDAMAACYEMAMTEAKRFMNNHNPILAVIVHSKDWRARYGATLALQRVKTSGMFSVEEIDALIINLRSMLKIEKHDIVLSGIQCTIDVLGSAE